MSEHKRQQKRLELPYSKLEGEEKKVEEDEIRPHQGSYLFESYMLWLLPILTGLAIWFKIVSLIIVGSFLILATGMVIYWKKKSLQLVEPSINLPRSRVFAGDYFQVQATVANAKWMPLVWLEWEQAQLRGISWGQEAKGPYIIRLLWLLWYQRISWVMEGRAERRGRYELGLITLRSGDAFRFSEEERQYQLHAALYVYPALLTVSVPAFKSSFLWEMRGKQGGFLEDPQLISGLREYQSGDEWRRIDWRASAKTGILQTRVYEKILTSKLHMLIDVRGFLKLEEGEYSGNVSIAEREQIQHKHDEFEWFLSVIASVALRYHEQKVQLSLSSNALDYKQEKMAAVPPSSNLTPFLDYLAMLSAKPASDSQHLLEQLLVQEMKYTPMFLFCEQITEVHINFWRAYGEQLPYLTFYYIEESDHVEKIQGAVRKMETLLARTGKEQ